MRLRKQYWEELDRLGQEWADLRDGYQKAQQDDLLPQETEKLRRAAENALSNLKVSIYEHLIEKSDTSSTFTGEYSQDIAILFTIKRLKNFDPKKSCFSAFLNNNLYYTELDYLEAQKKGKAHVDPSVDVETIGTRDRNALSDQAIHRLFLRFFQITSQMVSGGANSRAGFNQRELVYTEVAARYIKRAIKEDDYALYHEREVFQCMRLDYLDFFMSEECRTLLQIADTPTHLMEKLVDADQLKPGEKGTFCPLIPPAKVVISYLRRERGLERTAPTVTYFRQATMLAWIQLMFPDNPDEWRRILNYRYPEKITKKGSEDPEKKSINPADLPGKSFQKTVEEAIRKRKRELALGETGGTGQ